MQRNAKQNQKTTKKIQHTAKKYKKINALDTKTSLNKTLSKAKSQIKIIKYFLPIDKASNLSNKKNDSKEIFEDVKEDNILQAFDNSEINNISDFFGVCLCEDNNIFLNKKRNRFAKNDLTLLSEKNIFTQIVTNK